MANELVSKSFWRFPFVSPSFMEDIEDLLPTASFLNGLSVSEDEKNVYIEAAVPGVDPKDVDVTFHKGVLWIKAETKEEEKKKKYYRKATSSFSYRVAIPEDVDFNAEPKAECSKGVMKVTFPKSPKTEPKKIEVKAK